MDTTNPIAQARADADEYQDFQDWAAWQAWRVRQRWLRRNGLIEMANAEAERADQERRKL